MNSFGQVVRARRRQLGLTLEQLAKKVGTHKGYVSGTENGKVRPPAAKLTLKLAKALDLNALDLVELGWAEKAPALIRDRVRTRLQQDNPLYNAQIVEPEAPKVDMVIPSRKETA
jgi:transcriptional regulator with XRE-family HTH domain